MNVSWYLMEISYIKHFTYLLAICTYSLEKCLFNSFAHLKNQNIKSCILLGVKQITSPDLMHETSAWGWCTGMTQRGGMGKEVGGGIRMGNTCKSMADSCQCMAKTTTML